MKKQLGPKDILFPIPAALIVTGTFEKPNIITVSWIGMMSISPPILAIGVHESRYSFELIKKYKEFTANIPPVDKYKEVDYIGMVSGRDRNKFEDVGFSPLKSSNITTPIIAECPLNLECKVVNSLRLSGHTAIFGEILETHIDGDKISGGSPCDIDLGKINPLIYAATVGQYWSIGKKISESFKPGLQIKEGLL